MLEKMGMKASCNLEKNNHVQSHMLLPLDPRMDSPMDDSLARDLLDKFDKFQNEDDSFVTPEPALKRLKRSDAFVVESDDSEKKRRDAEYDELMNHYNGQKYIGTIGHNYSDTQSTELDSEAPSSSGKSGATSRENEMIPEPELSAPVVTKPEEPEEPDTPEMPESVLPDPPANSKGPMTQEEKKQQQLEQKRANSRAWHQKWVSKGVPKDPKDSTPASSEPTTQNKSMREHCQEFVSEWIKNSGMEASNERRVAAYKAWMESERRANLMAGRAGVQS